MSLRLPETFNTNSPLPDRIYGYVSVHSQGEEPIFALKSDRFPTDIEQFRSTSDDRNEARRALESIGFDIIAESRIGTAIAGPAGAYEELTGGRVVTVERLMHASAGLQRYVTHIDIVGDDQPEACGCARAQSSAARIEGVLIERPRQFQDLFPAPIPPGVDRFHLRVPDDVALGLSATALHQQGIYGDGVNVAMVDSGQYAHPFFAVHHYDVQPTRTVIAGTSPTEDPVGHGTGESANIFAAAPGCTLRPYRASNNQGRLVGAFGGFLQAKAGRPDILTNSWGGDGPYPPTTPPDEYDMAWAIEIYDAVQEGIFVVFSAGNGSFTIEPQVPGVLSAGGTYMSQGLGLQASDYSSGYVSPWFQNVVVPDVCGLVGMRPRAQYIMLPIQPGCEIDLAQSQPQFTDPNDDGTTASDGWALFSGTSAAAPQIAGVAALILEVKPGLTPQQIDEALKSSAVDVVTGHCHPRFNNQASAGRDSATGFGLVDAEAATQYALANF